MADSKNGVFLFYRDYMDYHADRFEDFSLLLFEGNSLIAIFPGNIKSDVLYSHGGLTFGGLISDGRMRTPLMVELFESMEGYLAGQGIARLIYKRVPHIYHILPAEEDLYALFLSNAQIIKRDVSSTIFMSEKVSFSKGRKWSVKKGKESGLLVKSNTDFAAFMAIEADILKKKHGVAPVHSPEEMELLANRFPDNIKLFGAFQGDKMLAGVIIYENRNIAHTQYIAGTDEGRELFATDLIIDYLINEYYTGKRYFDFGISTEQDGKVVNTGLVTQKEEYGARAVVYDTYEIQIKP
ncbi:MAG: GNAT family N-acetyltransferase [Dehalococcoidia bacterium]